MRLKKQDVGLDLVVLEQAGALAAQEEEVATDITAQVAAMTVGSSQGKTVDSSETDFGNQARKPGNSKLSTDSEGSDKRTTSDPDSQLDDLDLSSSTDSETSDSTDSSESSSTDSDTNVGLSDAKTLKVENSAEKESNSSRLSTESGATGEGNVDSGEAAVQPKLLGADLKAAEDGTGLEFGQRKVDSKSLNF